MTEQLTVDELLIAHAAGKLPEPVALVVATHLALCPEARRRYGRYEALGGSFLEAIEPDALAENAWEKMLSRLDEPEPEVLPAPRRPSTGTLLPLPLRDYVPETLDALRWRNYGTAAECELKIKSPGYRTKLIKVRAGRMVPQHTHEGHELTVVLEGAFHDETGRYRRGDLAIADSSVDHQPVADEGEDCLCLAVTDAPLRLTGRFGRLLNPFIRF